ncbi:hypothetical protein [Ferrimonas marina]|uniref:Uncharacterized protein n=1 Tax=Ferrimonas marina TaxID=299255 RepID=A0A1M5TU63_9GAMM|nr:hypothetical protein [Ferrimonas marina]SHH54221.1 hypothetical protein SAMN02745129_2277 [Ferrimonas marina]
MELTTIPARYQLDYSDANALDVSERWGWLTTTLLNVLVPQHHQMHPICSGENRAHVLTAHVLFQMLVSARVVIDESWLPEGLELTDFTRGDFELEVENALEYDPDGPLEGQAFERLLAMRPHIAAEPLLWQAVEMAQAARFSEEEQLAEQLHQLLKHRLPDA